uniref:very-long-chain enoyl-CoA reductase-like isoform X2 n=1 Tax=Erigeron canadensis TaxID=72917 RepID=UPI001CB8AA36|nr:very-long-chain enoyl-CoA reductase-like isoform X2 [Erigeron canadensis]
MVISYFLRVVFPPPPSLLVNAVSIVTLLCLIAGGYMEIGGKSKQYAKFFDPNTNKISKVEENRKLLRSRHGMLIFYTPSFIVGLVAFAIFPYQNLRFLILLYVLNIHFFKRILEVVFIHKFSGFMMRNVAITIGLSYTVSTATMIYAQYLSRESPEPCVDLKYVGEGMFLIGIIGNFYHHYILSKLRKNGNKEYKIPTGALFDLVICPHYFFEIVEFIGVSCISQTMFSFCFTLGTIFLLIGRSHATRKWYILKFGETFRKDIKAIVPYFF